MTVLNFIKENRVLVAGLTLPLLLMGVLALSRSLPASMVPLPTHQVVFYSQGWANKGQIVIKANDNGKITAAFNAALNYRPQENEQSPKSFVYLYDPQNNNVDTIEITLDKDDKVVLPQKLLDMKLSNTKISPDGYAFEPYYYRNSSLITEIFSYNSYNNRGPFLIKNGRVIKLPQPNLSYNSYELVGWVMEGETK